jgi:hypothetical protein
MEEEEITTSIVDWLVSCSWDIVSYDFPGSGSGSPLHPDVRERGTKNKGSIIPDIIAFKDYNVILIENKNRYLKSDFDKVSELCRHNRFEKAIENILGKRRFNRVSFGIGIPDDANALKKAESYPSKRDFLLAVNVNLNVSIIEDSYSLFAC